VAQNKTLWSVARKKHETDRFNGYRERRIDIDQKAESKYVINRLRLHYLSGVKKARPMVLLHEAAVSCGIIFRVMPQNTVDNSVRSKRPRKQRSPIPPAYELMTMSAILSSLLKRPLNRIVSWVIR
jgi:hypothetical protein